MVTMFRPSLAVPFIIGIYPTKRQCLSTQQRLSNGPARTVERVLTAIEGISLD
jgi:hypothetical protein